MKESFEPAMVELFKHEGGYVNHPSDPGGETNFGISKRSYPSVNIKGLTKAAAKKIYKKDFWDKVKGDELPAGIDNVVFDPAVNSGPSRGVKWLQAALGVAQDGVIGPATMAKAKASDPFKMIPLACTKRLAWLRGLGTFSTFGKGWSRRVAEVEAFSMKLAAQAKGVPVKDVAAQGVKDANGKANANAAAGVGGAGGSASVSTFADLNYSTLAVFAIAAILIGIWAYRRWDQQKERALAYSKLSEG